MRRPLLFVFTAVLLTGCNMQTTDTPVKDSTIVLPADTIPALRAKVAPGPAAEYVEKVPDELNDWKFSVGLYETKNTFDYTVRIRYKELRTSDLITIPDLNMLPKVAVRKGNTPLSCIIGFMDQKNQFMSYKLVSVKDDQLKITTTNHYRVGRYHRKL